MSFFRMKLLSSSFNKIKVRIPCNIIYEFWSIYLFAYITF